MQKVREGLFVSVDYTGTLQNGDVFDSSAGGRPLEVRIGSGQLFKGFEDALIGMALNEKKTFTLTPEEAYGRADDDCRHTFRREEIPAELDPRVGMAVGLTTEDGRQIPARIVSVEAEGVTVDLNHPLAGQTLTFDIEVVGISDTPTQGAGCGECGCASGAPDGACGSRHGDCGCGRH